MDYWTVFFVVCLRIQSIKDSKSLYSETQWHTAPYLYRPDEQKKLPFKRSADFTPMIVLAFLIFLRNSFDESHRLQNDSKR